MKSKFTEALVAAALRECASGTSVGQVARKLGVSEQTIYIWKKKYASRDVADIRKVHQHASSSGIREARATALRARMNELAAARPRYGYRTSSRCFGAKCGRTASTASSDTISLMASPCVRRRARRDVQRCACHRQLRPLRVNGGRSISCTIRSRRRPAVSRLVGRRCI